MFPSLTVAFLFGLLVGSQLPLFPISSIALLAATAFGFTLLEREGHLDTMDGNGPTVMRRYSRRRVVCGSTIDTHDGPLLLWRSVSCHLNFAASCSADR